MKCTDIDAALGALKARPLEPHKLTDERGTVVVSMYTPLGFELKTVYGRALPFAEDETRDYLTFMSGAVTLTPMNAATYLLETS